MSKNLSELSGRKGILDNLFDKMGEAAAEEGTPSQEKLDLLAEEFLVGKSSTYGTITAYDFMKPENKGKKAYVCNGSACICAGTQEAVIAELEKKFNADEIGHMTCLGRCHENGAFNIGGKNYSAKSSTEIAEIVAGKGSNQDKYNVGSNKEVLTAPYDGLETHYEILKRALSQDS